MYIAPSRARDLFVRDTKSEYACITPLRTPMCVVAVGRGEDNSANRFMVAKDTKGRKQKISRNLTFGIPESRKRAVMLIRGRTEARNSCRSSSQALGDPLLTKYVKEKRGSANSSPNCAEVKHITT